VNHLRAFADQVESLTAREVEVLRLIAEGAGSRDIATRLGISYATVRSHIRSVGAKLGVHSKGEAVVKAKRLAIIG
jgi:DNA-binding CsgD family transcriptional regulator